MEVEVEIEALKRQMSSCRRQLQQQNEWLDTVCSPIWKRIFWWLRGFKFYRLGRWYGD